EREEQESSPANGRRQPAGAASTSRLTPAVRRRAVAPFLSSFLCASSLCVLCASVVRFCFLPVAAEGHAVVRAQGQVPRLRAEARRDRARAAVEQGDDQALRLVTLGHQRRTQALLRAGA